MSGSESIRFAGERQRKGRVALGDTVIVLWPYCGLD